MAGNLVVGPLLTAFGARSWFWACRPSLIVAVPGGFWATIQAAVMTSGVGGAAGALALAPGMKKGGVLARRLESASDAELQALPGAAVYPVADVTVIECRRVLLGTSPDVIVCTRDGGRTKYGLANALALDALADALRGCYGELVQGP